MHSPLVSRSLWLSVAVTAAVAVGPGGISPATAAPWLKLDRVEAEPSWFEGITRVRVYVTAVTLEGGLIPVFGKKQWTLQLGSSKKEWPCIVGHFKTIEDELAVALVIETSDDFAEAMPAIKAALKDFLDKLPKTTQVGLIVYSEEVEGDRRAGNKQKALRAIDDLEASLPASELHLLDAVSDAVKLLKRVKPSSPWIPLRRMVVVISDGNDVDADPGNYRQVAKKADDADIRIHTMAYSRTNQRRPMLGLGELSKRTYGTFRLIRSNVSFEPNFRQLLEEIEGQYVLTYYLPAEQVAGKKLRVLANDLVSNDSRVKSITCGDQTCGEGQFCVAGGCVSHPEQGGSGILSWILAIVGGLVGLLVLLLGVGLLLGRRDRKRAAAVALAQAALEAQAVGEPSHRIVGQGPGGAAHPPPPAAPAVHAAPVGRTTGGAPFHPAPAAGLPTLFILQGPRQGQRLALRHGFTIGKAPNCDLVLTDDAFASSHHAQLHMDAALRCSLVDLHSTNGTFVNGVRVTEERRLVGGEAIRVGATEMRFLQQ